MIVAVYEWFLRVCYLLSKKPTVVGNLVMMRALYWGVRLVVIGATTLLTFLLFGGIVVYTASNNPHVSGILQIAALGSLAFAVLAWFSLIKERWYIIHITERLEGFKRDYREAMEKISYGVPM